MQSPLSVGTSSIPSATRKTAGQSFLHGHVPPCAWHTPSLLQTPATACQVKCSSRPASLPGPWHSHHAISCQQQGHRTHFTQQPARPGFRLTARATAATAGAAPQEDNSIWGSIAEKYHSFTAWASKFMPMVGLFFLLAFVNTILDSLKDTLVITATGGGAQVIPYLTVYAVLPSSLAFLLAYSYASQHLSRPALFNAIVMVFMSFFTLFAFVLYPNHATLHPHTFADGLAKILPQGVEGLVGMFRNWTFTAFFCMSELWGDVCLGLLFWGLANDTTQLADAPTLYPLFGLGANVAQAMGGWVLKAFSAAGRKSGNGDFGAEIQQLMLVVMGFTCAALTLHAYINKTHDDARQRRLERRARRAAAAKNTQQQSVLATQTVSDDEHGSLAAPHFIDNHSVSSLASSSNSGVSMSSADEGQAAAGKDKPTKSKPSVREIFGVLASSTPIRCLAIMSLAQGLCTNLMEFAWKSHIGLLYPSPTQFTAFLGDVSVWQGVVTGCLMVLSPAMFSKVGWSGVACATPLILLWGGAAFFTACLVYQFAFASHATTAVSLISQATNSGAAAVAASHMTSGVGGLVLQGLVFGGALLYVFSKSAKFSLFKPAEEMVYISLDEEGRTKGKAAIDVVGSQAGKSGGSVLQQALLLLSGGTIAGILPIMACFYFAMAQGWLKAVATLAGHAEYGSPNTAHESLSSANAANLSSCDDDDTPLDGMHIPQRNQLSDEVATPNMQAVVAAQDAQNVVASQPSSSSFATDSARTGLNGIRPQMASMDIPQQVAEPAPVCSVVDTTVSAAAKQQPKHIGQHSKDRGAAGFGTSFDGSGHSNGHRHGVNGSSSNGMYSGYANAMHAAEQGGNDRAS